MIQTINNFSWQRWLTFSFLTLAGLLAGGCRQQEAITFQRIENVRFHSLALTGEVTLLADAVFQNPNDFGVRIKRSATQVFIDDRVVSQVEQQIGSEMAPRTDFRLPIRIQVPAKALFEGDLQSILDGLARKKTIRIKMEGAAVVDLLGVEISIPFRHEEEKGLKL